MKPIDKIQIQQYLDEKLNKPLYLHLETTTGAYSAHRNESNLTVVAFIRNAEITYEQAKITGNGPFRIGLKMPHGWTYAEGLTDFTIDEQDRLLAAGHHPDGKLAIAFQLSESPFPS
ncbi:YojF family protein [Metabacillus sp. GX 13764]|uniref:YojF family protein n=1 Tax=Metabacillus kandeliae TaxID=2900151 RepID=UPI001E52F633|nr:YojF family protein [Metabacillus kandeliae]MCD7033513.1 YojF family protein [Metabacillus kandeliae]